MQGKSSLINHIEFSKEVPKKIHEAKMVDGVYIDFSMVSDKVLLGGPLQKVKTNRITGV